MTNGAAESNNPDRPEPSAIVSSSPASICVPRRFQVRSTISSRHAAAPWLTIVTATETISPAASDTSTEGRPEPDAETTVT